MTIANGDAAVIYYFPLFGLRHGDDRCAERGRLRGSSSGPWSSLLPDPEDGHWCKLAPGVGLNRPDLDDWLFLERTDVARESVTRYGNQVPFAITVVAAGPHGDVLAAWGRAQDLAGDFVVALRLHKDGAFLDPTYAGLYAEQGNFSTRLPSPYRQSLFGEPFEGGYLFAEDDRGPVAALAAMLESARRDAAETALRSAIENLRYSYGYSMPASASLLMLFTSMEAILGGFGDVVAGVTLPDRAAVGASEHGGSGSEVRAFLAGPGRDLRNALAHDDFRNEVAPNAIEMMRDVVRTVLRRYLNFWTQMNNPMAPASPCLIPFRRLLSSAARGDAEALDRLRALD